MRHLLNAIACTFLLAGCSDNRRYVDPVACMRIGGTPHVEERLPVNTVDGRVIYVTVLTCYDQDGVPL